MNTDCCQSATRARDHGSEPASRWRRARAAARWLVPGVTLVFIPKCPLCLATYVALATGLGLSLPVAAFLRTTLLVVCASALALAAGGTLRRFWRRRSAHRGPGDRKGVNAGQCRTFTHSIVRQ